MKFVCLLISFLILTSTCIAQSDEQFSESERKAFSSITSAITALSSDDNLAAGTYTFKNNDSPDAELDLLKYVGEFSIGDRDSDIVPLIEISPSTLNAEQLSGDQQLKVEIDSWSIGIGAGVLFKFLDERLQATPRFKVDYSEVEYSFSSTTLDVTGTNARTPDFDVWSFIPSVELNYSEQVSERDARLGYDTRLSFIYLESDPNLGTIDSFSDRSWIWRNAVYYEYPFSWESLGTELVLRPNIARVDVHGSARDGFEFNNFYEAGVELVDQDLESAWFSELGVGATYVYEKEVQGWILSLIVGLA